MSERGKGGEVNRYKTIFDMQSAEIEVKKSKFLSELHHVETDEEAEAVIKTIKKRYYDASHHCSAYIVRGDGGIRHASDDGEPSGTAGKPMLDVLSGAGLSDAIVVVTRYFGGTLLGTGGLVRAYSEAAAEVIKRAKVREIIGGSLFRFQVDYGFLPKLLYLANEQRVLVYETEYLDKVSVGLLIPPELHNKFFKELTELTAGAMTEDLAEDKKDVFYYVGEDKKAILLQKT